MKKFVQYIFLVLLLIIGISGCESEKKYPPKGYLPVDAKATETLEAAYFWLPQDKLSSSYWKSATYVEVSLSDLSENKLYPDGYLNMTSTYKGLSTFNRGKNPKVTLKAGYDNEYLYLLVEWNDTTTNASYMTRLWQGPEDQYKNDSSTGWSSQRNNDNLVIYFDNEVSNSGNAWKWSLASTAPFDMALNLKTDESGISGEAKPIYRNGDDENPRSVPVYEWNGIRQDIVMPDGSTKVLDPAYFLVDNYKMEFKGNIQNGEVVFNSIAHCSKCHGLNGNGDSETGFDGGPLNDVFTNKYSREGLVEFIGSSEHEGGGSQYFGKIKNDSVKVENLITFLRGIAGVPGNILVQPEAVPEIKALTNISLGGIQKKNSRYQVLLKRKLITENPDDVDFSPGSTYTVSIQFSDNDEINYVGSSGIQLIFNSKEL